VLVIACVAGALASACRDSTPAPASPTPVRVQKLEPLEGDAGMRYSGSVIPGTQVSASFKVGGYVREIAQVRGADGLMRLLQQGDPVRRGQVVAHVDETEYADRVKMAEADLVKARAVRDKNEEDFRRADNLYATQSITAPEYDRAKKDLETAQASVSAAEAQLDEARVELAYCALTVPMSGVVLRREIEVGTLVHPGSVGFVVADLSSVKIVFGVPDVMLEHVKSGEPLEFTTASFPDATFSGVVTSIAPSADPSSRVFQVEVSADNSHGQLRDGMVAALEVDAQRTNKPAVGVPLSAVVRAPDDPEGFAVFVIEGGQDPMRAGLRPVEVGPVFGNSVAIVGGVSPEERIVVTGAKLLTDGAPVSVIP
jgi:RND family efflux transporter MFP subunit